MSIYRTTVQPYESKTQYFYKKANTTQKNYTNTFKCDNKGNIIKYVDKGDANAPYYINHVDFVSASQNANSRQAFTIIICKMCNFIVVDILYPQHINALKTILIIAAAYSKRILGSINTANRP